MDLEKRLPDVIDAINIVNKEKNRSLEIRLRDLQESSKNAELWNKVSKGFNTVKNSSIGVFAIAAFGACAAIETGLHTDTFGFLTSEFKSLVGLAYGAASTYILMEFYQPDVIHHSNIKTHKQNTTKKELINDVREHFNQTHEYFEKVNNSIQKDEPNIKAGLRNMLHSSLIYSKIDNDNFLEDVKNKNMNVKKELPNKPEEIKKRPHLKLVT